MCGTALGTTAVLKLSKVIQILLQNKHFCYDNDIAATKEPERIEVARSNGRKGLVLAVLSAGMTFSTLKISVGALLFGKNNRSCK